MNAVINKRMLSGRWRFGGAVMIVVVAFGLGGAGIALGGSPPEKCQGKSAASNQYCQPAKVVAGESGSNSGGGSPPAAGNAAGGALPFTGVSLIWPAIAAIALVSLGLGLRRHEHKKT